MGLFFPSSISQLHTNTSKMGAGASAAHEIDGDDIPHDIREAYQQCEEIKQNISVKDAQFIHGQSTHNWKDHTHLISLLSERTKSQLISAAKVFPEYDGEGLNVNDGVSAAQATKRLERKLHSMLGGTPYAEFMKDCVMCPEAVDVELLADSLNYLGTNEHLLAEIFCTSTSEELQRTSALFEQETKYKLIDRVIKKTKLDGPFQKFICRILTHSRNPNSEADVDVRPQVEALRQAGLGSDLPRDDDRIFEILGQASRVECERMEMIFKTDYDVDLQDAIRVKFNGSVALALVLWTEGHINDAIAQRIEHNLETTMVKRLDANGEVSKVQVDVRLLSHIFSRYDHWQLKLVRDSYLKIFGRDLADTVASKLTGKCKRAVIAWITSGKTCDGGYERRVWELLQENARDNYSSLRSDGAKMEELRGLLAAQHSSLIEYAETHHIHMPPSITRKNAAEKVAGAGAAGAGAADGAGAAGAGAADGAGAGAKGGGQEGAGRAVTYEEKFALVQEYLLEMIKIEDFDNSGVLDENDLYLILTDMELGYTEEEMAAFSSWIDVDKDGHIDYSEILRELVDDVVQVIEDVGHVTVPEKLADLRLQRDHKFAKLNMSLNESGHVTAAGSSTASTTASGGGPNTAPGSTTVLPPSLIEYLRDTFNEVDVDHSGSLNRTELNNILHTVLANSEGDKELLNIEWDKDRDGAVSWEEASKAFTSIFNKYINSKNDYWIALVDKTNGNFFWYNVRDQNSFWMTEGDRVMYQARSHEEHLTPSKIPCKSSVSSSSSTAVDCSSLGSSVSSAGAVISYQELRRIQKQKFDAAKNKQL